MPTGISNEVKSRSSTATGWFTVPAPLARLFKKFPLLTYPPNELPARSPQARDVPILYVFISNEDALRGLPSFNPSCLKWQTFLKLAGVDFRVSPSNNHASPTGALPFLLCPSRPDEPKAQIPIPSNKLEAYARSRVAEGVPSVQDRRLDTYESLLDHRVRNAWLYALYLSPSNSELLSQLYIDPVSESFAVKTAMLYQLRRAAESEIQRSTGRVAVDPTALYAGAQEAFGALETLLATGNAEHSWFFDVPRPALFDATVFSYTHLMLDARLAWKDRTLAEMLKQFPQLVNHQEKIAGMLGLILD